MRLPCRQSLSMICLIVAACTPSGAAAEAQWLSPAGSGAGAEGGFALPVPPGSRIEPVSGEMIIDGFAHSVIEFRSDRAVEEVMQWYREHWRGPHLNSPVQSQAIGPWQIASDLSDQALTVVQARPVSGRGTYALVSRRQLDSVVRGRSRNTLDVPVGMQLLAHSESRLSDGQARTWVLRGLTTRESSQRALMSSLRRDGWTLLEQRSKSAMLTTHLVRGSHYLDTVVLPGEKPGATLVIINEAER